MSTRDTPANESIGEARDPTLEDAQENGHPPPTPAKTAEWIERLEAAASAAAMAAERLLIIVCCAPQPKLSEADAQAQYDEGQINVEDLAWLEAHETAESSVAAYEAALRQLHAAVSELHDALDAGTVARLE